MSAYLYVGEDLPEGFRYPIEYIEITNMDVIPDLEPWSFICEFKESSSFWLTK